MTFKEDVKAAPELDSSSVTVRSLRADELSRPTEERALPLVLEAAKDARLPFLLDWVGANRAGLRESILRAGGILFRGFEVLTALDYEAVLRALQLDLSDEYPMGVAPRHKVTDYIFTSSEAPSNHIISAHNEMARLSRRVGWISFYCSVEPKVHGETPIFNSRGILNDLAPKVREMLSRRPIRYVHYYPKEKSMLPSVSGTIWPNAFGTTDKDAIRKICAAMGATCRFGFLDRLHVETTTPAIVEHPETRERCINLQLSHWFSYVRDLNSIADRQNRLRNLYTQLIIASSGMLGTRTLSIRFEDGRIPLRVISHLRKTAWKHSVVFRWRKGDVLVLDNILTAHARMNVVQPRMILAAFGNMIQFRVKKDGAATTLVA